MLCTSAGRKLLCCTSLEITSRLLCVGGRSQCGTLSELHHDDVHGVFGMLCTVRTQLRSWQLRCTLLFVKLFALGVLSYCKYDMGALLWLGFERAPIPLFGRLVRCSAPGCSFARLRYTPFSCALLTCIYPNYELL